MFVTKFGGPSTYMQKNMASVNATETRYKTAPYTAM